MSGAAFDNSRVQLRIADYCWVQALQLQSGCERASPVRYTTLYIISSPNSDSIVFQIDVGYLSPPRRQDCTAAGPFRIKGFTINAHFRSECLTSISAQGHSY